MSCQPGHRRSRAAFFAIAEWAVRTHQPALGLGVLLGGHCVLRTSELTTLTWSQFSWNDNFEECHISLGLTKSGARRGAAESVTITLPWLAVAVKAIEGMPGEPVIGTNSARFRTFFAEALKHLGYTDWDFKPYSLRRGGATEMWRKTGNLAQVTLRGRWGMPQRRGST